MTDIQERLGTMFEEHIIDRIRRWSGNSVREACIRNNLYTRGDNEAYSAMLDRVDRNPPTTKAMYITAKDIAEHSRDQSITNVMFILERECVITTFEINGSCEI